MCYPPTHVLSVAGSVAVLGEQAEIYQGVTVMAVLDRHVEVALAPRTDGKILLMGGPNLEKHEFWLSNVESAGGAAWVQPLKRALVLLRHRGVHFSGFNAIIQSALPPLPWVGEMEAAVVGLVLGIRQLCPFKLTDTGIMRPPQRDKRGRLPPLSTAEKMSIARLCYLSFSKEDEASISNCIGPLFARPFHLQRIDHFDGTISQVPIPGTVALVLSGEGGKVSKPKQERLRYDPGLIRETLLKLGVKSLRHADREFVLERGGILDDRQFGMIWHASAEVRCIYGAEEALREGDIQTFGKLMNEVFSTARDFLGTGNLETEILVGATRKVAGVLGTSKLGGAGVVGILNLVLLTRGEELRGVLARAYSENTGKKLETCVSHLGSC